MSRLRCIIFLLVIFAILPAHAQSPDADRINTPGWTDSPFITPDGQRLYFMYTPFNFMPWLLRGESPVHLGPDRPGHHPNPAGNPWGDSDVYMAERLPGGTWSAPVNLPFNDDGADACIMTTADGSTIYWQKDTGSADIFVVHRADDSIWTSPQRLPAPVNLPDSHETNPHISTDEQTLYFTSDRPGGFGGTDLYIATGLDESYSLHVQNLGPVINSADDEDQLWLSQDNTTLYFNRGGQIFTATRQDNAWAGPVLVEFEGSAPLFAAEVSITADGRLMVLAVPDLASERLIIMQSERLPDGRWSQPAPID